MNVRLILLLSLFGAAMAVATVFVIPPKIEPLFWLAIFVACAVIVARRAPGKYFLHGLCVSLANSVWITATHIALFDSYASTHPDEVAKAAEMGSPRLMMAITGPVIGLVSGVVLGLFCLGASKLLGPRKG